MATTDLYETGGEELVYYKQKHVSRDQHLWQLRIFFKLVDSKEGHGAITHTSRSSDCIKARVFNTVL